MSVFEQLRPHVTTTGEPFRFCGLAGQQTAEALASATLDNVLCVLIDQTPDQKWGYDIITDVPGVVYGTPEGDPGYETRERAEQAALYGLAMLGRKGTPTDDYEPVPNPDDQIRIILSHAGWSVPVWPPEVVQELLGQLDISFGDSMVEKTARLADQLVTDFDPKNIDDRISLTILANCGWSHVSRTVVDEYCAAHGIDL